MRLQVQINYRNRLPFSCSSCCRAMRGHASSLGPLRPPQTTASRPHVRSDTSCSSLSTSQPLSLFIRRSSFECSHDLSPPPWCATRRLTFRGEKRSIRVATARSPGSTNQTALSGFTQHCRRQNGIQHPLRHSCRRVDCVSSESPFCYPGTDEESAGSPARVTPSSAFFYRCSSPLERIRLQWPLSLSDRA